MNKQPVLVAAAARTAEVAGLKRDLKQAEEELGLTKRLHEENKGEWYPVHISYRGGKRKIGKLVMLTKSIMIL